MPEEKSVQNQAAQNQARERKLCQAWGDFRSTTNIRELEAYYSLVNRKFIRGYYGGTRVGGKISYRLYEGAYIRFDGHVWWKEDPPYRIEACMVRLRCEDGEAELEFVACAVVEYKNPPWLAQNREIPRQFVDFHAAIPCYHCYPAINFSKVYTEEEHRQLVEFILAKKYLVEGEENE